VLYAPLDLPIWDDDPEMTQTPGRAEKTVSSIRRDARESLVLPGGENERQESDIIDPDGALPIAWWVGFKIEDDETWERVKNGTYQMFSIEGKATREPIGKSVQSKTFLELLKYNPNHGKDGKFTSGGTNGLTSGAGGGTLQSSQKPIGENGGILQSSAFEDVFVRGHGRFKLVKGSKVTHIYSFAGKGTKRTVDIEKGLMKRFGGKAGHWQHTTGNGVINYKGSKRAAEIHWFQENSVGIKLPKVKRWLE
jgi:hypothetical protein